MLTCCQLLSKQGEGEESFDSSQEEEDQARTKGAEVHLEIVRRLLDFVDYSLNKGSKEAWGLMSSSLRALILGGQGGRVGEVWGASRGTWWWKLNYSDLEEEEVVVLGSKGSVVLLLEGRKSKQFKAVAEEVRRRREATDSPALTAVAQELESLQERVGQPCLPPSKEERLDQRFLVQEWRDIEDINKFKYSKEAKKNPEFLYS